MGGYRKLALIAAVVALGYVSQAQAAVMTESAFFNYYSQYSWTHSYAYMRYFMSWTPKSPEFSRANVQWVIYQTHPGFVPSTVMPGASPLDGDAKTFYSDPVPPWRRGPAVPEPTTAAISGLGLGVLALRRRRA